MRMILNFQEIRKEDVLTAGGKGANLGEMTAAGIAVPDGFVVTADAYRAFLKENELETVFETELGKVGQDEVKLVEAAGRLRSLILQGHLPKEVEDAIRKRYEEMGEQARVAVRSSATAEDLPDASFAGQQETYLNVRGIDEVLEKVKRCYASLWGNRAVCYRSNQGYDQMSVALAVVIQQMMESEKAGVLFTVNPITHQADEMQINASYGLGESVVSGRVTADSYLCDKEGTIKSCEIGSKMTQIVYAASDTREVPVDSKMQQMRCLSEQEIKALCTEAVRVEQHYKRPMDIEWGISRGRVYILQARAITTLGTEQEKEKEQIAAYIKDTKLNSKEKANMAFLLEKMPYAYRPLDRAFMLAINHQKEKIFLENGIRLSADPQMDEDGIQTLPVSGFGMNKNIFKLFGTMKLLKDFDRCTMTCRAFMDKYEAEVSKIREIDFTDKTAAECGAFLRDSLELVNELAYDRFKYALFPSVLAKDLEQAVQKVDPGYTKYDLLGGLNNKTAEVTRDMEVLAREIRQNPVLTADILAGTDYETLCVKYPVGRKLFAQFLEKNGYKSDYNCYCVSAKTLLEDPDRFLHILQPLLAADGQKQENEEKDFGKLMAKLKKIYQGKYPALEKRIEQFRYFHVVREESQYLWETIFYCVRKCLRRLNELLLGNADFEQGIGNLFIDELLENCKRGSLSDSDREKIVRRNRMHPLSQKVWDASKVFVFDAQGDVLKGVSGSAGVAVGKVCIVHGPEEFYKMQKGDILVCQLTDPEWTPLFGLANAVVADTGSALSHAAIVAREYGIPAVLGVGFATTKYQDGDTVKVDGDRGEVTAC